jgi:D-sedoheptulose 7-phosphate isomerase
MEITVFTNGCFDIIHPGHISLLEHARDLGTKLIVGINSDNSIKAIKGDSRPFFNQNDRVAVLKSLRCVDEVLIFEETTPENLIKRIKPDVLVKGGDWATNEIIGGKFVVENGGKVISIPLREGYSSSRIVEKIQENSKIEPKKIVGTVNIIEQSISQHLEVFQHILKNQQPLIKQIFETILNTINNGNKILICGNGGSAADAQHIAAEFVGRYETERKALPAIAVTTDTSALTAIANDYGFTEIFSRQIKALGQNGDLLIALSTSGNSPNVNLAVMTARELGLKTIGLTGARGKKLASLCDLCWLVPAERTARIQEAHITIAHILCEMVDAEFKSK